MKAFTLSRIPKTYFGKGALEKVPAILHEQNARSVFLLTGGKSFKESPHYANLPNSMNAAGIKISEAQAGHEPSPEMVDAMVESARNEDVDTVLAIGGGSVLDAGKAVSAMVKVPGSVKEYLEGVGTRNHNGCKLPFIAVPTTSGTGSEATKNAVLSTIGEKGFKKSLRHDNFIPDFAILDPELTLNLPFQITAASGMDALNQLIEGYLSIKANPFTDALALSGIQKILNSLEALCSDRPQDVELRGDMAYAAYLSGIVLANAGLGYVHGFAGSIGGLADIPHGVVCGKLNACIFEAVVRCVIDDKDTYGKTYSKLLAFADVAGIDSAEANKKLIGLTERLYQMEERLKLPSLSSYGIHEDIIKKAVSMTSGKECPVSLPLDKLTALVLSRR